MKETLLKFATYNAAANRKLYDVVGPLSHEQLTRASGSYFGTILGLLNHILKSDIGWLHRLHVAEPSLSSLDTPAIETPRSLGFTENLFDDLQALSVRRGEVDEVYVNLITEASEAYLERREKFVNRQGKEQILCPGDILLHVLNHATHHRGAISQILDAMSVENDYSSFISTIEG